MKKESALPVVKFSAGPHTVKLLGREDGIKIRAIRIADSASRCTFNQAQANPHSEQDSEKKSAKAGGKGVRFRRDFRCGKRAPVLADGDPVECDPKGSAPCCSALGWCGGSPSHCSCKGCHNYRAGSFWVPPGESFCVGTRSGAGEELSFSRLLPNSDCNGEGFKHEFNFDSVNDKHSLTALTLCIGHHRKNKVKISAKHDCSGGDWSLVASFPARTAEAALSSDKIFCVIASDSGDTI